jgi:hypothetical protein
MHVISTIIGDGNSPSVQPRFLFDHDQKRPHVTTLSSIFFLRKGLERDLVILNTSSGQEYYLQLSRLVEEDSVTSGVGCQDEQRTAGVPVLLALPGTM